MDTETRERKMSALRTILDQMDVPEGRKKNLRWLARNLAVRNKDHPLFETARELLVQILKSL